MKRIVLAVVLLAEIAACSEQKTKGRSLTADSLPVLVGAGDIADCNGDGREQTARILDTIPGTVFVAGDAAYRRKRVTDPLSTCYEPAWGRHKARTRPAPGNHEYETGDATMYFNYFGASAAPPNGYYSYDLGTWHVVVLNTAIAVSGGSDQIAWLRQDLDAHAGKCTVAYMHHPRFSSGPHEDRERIIPIWRELQEYGVTVAIAGHDHVYERFMPMDAEGRPDSLNGVRQFVVGTGGASRYRIDKPLAGSEVRTADDFGVLKLTLLPTSYRWEFIPVDQDGFHDRGESACRPTHSIAR